MRWSLLLAGLVLLAPGVSACQSVWPIVDLDFEDARTEGCGYRDADPAACPPLPTEPTSYAGTLNVRVVMDAPCIIEPPTGLADLHVALDRTESHPAWVTTTFEPARFVIPVQEVYDPRNMHTDGQNVWFEVERDLQAMIGRAAWPDPSEMQVVEERGGLVTLFAKAHVTSGDGGLTWRDAFGVEEFRYDGRLYLPPEVHDVEVQQEAPIGIGFLLAPLGAAAVRIRSRR